MMILPRWPLLLCLCLLALSLPAEEDVKLRVATFNIRCPMDKVPNDWVSRAPRVKALLDRHQFEIVGLQEATHRQIQFLLKDPAWAFVGRGRADGKNGGEHAGILYRPERFEMLATETFWLSETPTVPGSKSWDSANIRVCTWGHFRDRRSGKEFVLFNTHLDHRSKTARLEGVKLILAKMDEVAKGLPVILLGDFNTAPTRPPILAIREKLHNSKAVSTIAHLGPIGTYTGFTYDRDNPPKKEIDYIFVSKDIRVHSHCTIDDMDGDLCASDHFPVLCEVSLL